MSSAAHGIPVPSPSSSLFLITSSAPQAHPPVVCSLHAPQTQPTSRPVLFHRCCTFVRTWRQLHDCVFFPFTLSPSPFPQLNEDGTPAEVDPNPHVMTRPEGFTPSPAAAAAFAELDAAAAADAAGKTPTPAPELPASLPGLGKPLAVPLSKMPLGNRFLQAIARLGGPELGAGDADGSRGGKDKAGRGKDKERGGRGRGDRGGGGGGGRGRGAAGDGRGRGNNNSYESGEGYWIVGLGRETTGLFFLRHACRIRLDFWWKKSIHDRSFRDGRLDLSYLLSLEREACSMFFPLNSSSILPCLSWRPCTVSCGLTLIDVALTRIKLTYQIPLNIMPACFPACLPARSDPIISSFCCRLL